jgi:hypothetical protein
MRYAVLGTGIVGRTLAARLDALGHEVVVGTRDAAATRARTEPDRMGTAPYARWEAEHPRVRLASFAQAAAEAQVVLAALDGQSALTALHAAGADALAGKVLIDVSNPLDFSAGFPPRFDPVDTDSLGEQVQRAFPDARVVKSLNTVNCEVMVDPARIPGAHSIFVCGNDPEAKKSVSALLAEFGWPAAEIVDLGGIEAARGTEMLVRLWLTMMGRFGTADVNIRVVKAP